jgi:predicted enzyme related to lactoylglutathione lyase
MRRFHVHVSVENLESAVRFYSTLFGVAPSVQYHDYAKWMLEEPRVNFAISQRERAAGVNHLGFQLDSTEELHGMRAQLQAADAGLVEEAAQACCYARSDKYWVTDPAGIAWETFHTLGSIPMFGEETSSTTGNACCVPLASIKTLSKSQACCVPAGSVEASSSSSTG